MNENFDFDTIITLQHCKINNMNVKMLKIKLLFNDKSTIRVFAIYLLLIACCDLMLLLSVWWQAMCCV